MQSLGLDVKVGSKTAGTPAAASIIPEFATASVM